MTTSNVPLPWARTVSTSGRETARCHARARLPAEPHRPQHPRPAEVHGAVAEGADYIGFGPIYPTTTKETGFSSRGLRALQGACGQFRSRRRDRWDYCAAAAGTACDGRPWVGGWLGHLASAGSRPRDLQLLLGERGKPDGSGI